jgi:hypothetical protein
MTDSEILLELILDHVNKSWHEDIRAFFMQHENMTKELAELKAKLGA